jgi:hypothetical protein
MGAERLICGGKLRIRVFSWASFDYFSHTPTKGDINSNAFGHGSREGYVFINLAFLRQSGKGTYLCPILRSEGS